MAQWDRSFGHFTTRQNIQFNWPKLSDIPDILQALADVEMHAIQTSGNCIRNVTADHFAGAAADEIEDPRPTAELIRQWSTEHPEFLSLPRKFKVAVTGSPNDRAVTKAHDIGLRMVRDENGNAGYEVIVGGGMGRTPMIGKVIRDFLPKEHLLPYLESILRVYNLHGRRDNKYKARIKILVHEEGLDEIKSRVESEFEQQMASDGGPMVSPDPAEVARIAEYFASPNYHQAPNINLPPEVKTWAETNTSAHKQAGYTVVTVSLKAIGAAAGDATSDQMRVLADLGEKYSHDELRVSHEQNIVLPHVRIADLPQLYKTLKDADLATGNIGLISDMIVCPGMDYCALATARSIPIGQAISKKFANPDLARKIGEMKIKISGCINACGHHHVGHIGILGLDKAGVENYQITLGGDATETTAIGTRMGPGFDADQVVPALERLIDAYLELRNTPEEIFLDTYRRLGAEPFKAALYPETKEAA